MPKAEKAFLPMIASGIFFLFCANVVVWFFPSTPKHSLGTFVEDVGFFQASIEFVAHGYCHLTKYENCYNYLLLLCFC